jgi:transcriptional regulator with XRE-family HTH domain
MPKKEKKEVNKYLKKFGRRLALLKKESKMSYRKIASKCNIEHSDIKRYVDGEINPTLLSIIELSKGFGVKTNVLLDIEWEEDSFEEEGN